MSSVSDTGHVDGSVAVFCSYSHKDERYREQFEAHVSLMKRQNLIQIWQDRKILAGDDWGGEIDSHLNSADLITLFVSADFLNSDYCYDKEMTRAMERHASERVPVVPIIVRQCDWHEAPFGKLQAVPTDGKPITSWENTDEAWTEVAKLLKLTVKALLERVRQKLKDQEERAARIKDPLAFIFPDDDPEKIAEQKEKAYEWLAKNRRERSDTLLQTQAKIATIDSEIVSGADQRSLDSYARWYEYIKTA